MTLHKLFRLRRSLITLSLLIAFFGVSLHFDVLQPHASAEKNIFAAPGTPNLTATAGDLDPTFGTGGIIANVNLTGFLGRLFYSDIKLQADGKIIVTGGNERTGLLGATAQGIVGLSLQPQRNAGFGV